MSLILSFLCTQIALSFLKNKAPWNTCCENPGDASSTTYGWILTVVMPVYASQSHIVPDVALPPVSMLIA